MTALGAARHLLLAPLSPQAEFYLTISMIAIYGALCVCVMFFLLRMCYYRHNMLGFQGGFLVLCVAWTAFRAACFSDPYGTWSAGPVIITYWFPINIQFAIFSLLIAFYARVIFQSSWDGKNRVRGIVAYTVVNSLALIGFAVWAVAAIRAEQAGDDAAAETLLKTRLFISFGLFMVLVAALACFLVAILRMENTSSGSALIMTITSSQRASRGVVVLVTLVIMLMLLSRAAFDVLSACGVFNRNMDGGVAGHLRFVTAEVFCLHLLWEVLPTLFILIFFRRVPSHGIGMFHGEASQLPARYQPTIVAHPAVRGAGTINAARHDAEPLLTPQSYGRLGKSPFVIWNTPQPETHVHIPGSQRSHYGTTFASVSYGSERD